MARRLGDDGDRTNRLRAVAEAVALIILLAPTLAAVASVVAFTIPGCPVIRRRPPVGTGLTSPCFQFRTAPDGQAADAVGAFLRRTSLDLLPSLIDVAGGSIRLGDLFFARPR